MSMLIFYGGKIWAKIFAEHFEPGRRSKFVDGDASMIDLKILLLFCKLKTLSLTHLTYFWPYLSLILAVIALSFLFFGLFWDTFHNFNVGLFNFFPNILLLQYQTFELC